MPILAARGSGSSRGFGQFGIGKLGAFDNPAANATVLYNAGNTTSGHYWIKGPNGSVPKYVYCDMTNQGGSWMLMMAIPSGTLNHLGNSESKTTVDGNSAVPLVNNNAYRWSTTEINEFLYQPGNKIMWIEPQRSTLSTTLNSNAQWFIRPGTQSQPIWPTNLECPNRDALIGNSQTAYVATGYGSASNAVNNTGGYTGDYTGATHWYPTIYSAGQSFFGAQTPEQGGIRFTNGSGFNTQGFLNNQPGYLWLKVY